DPFNIVEFLAQCSNQKGVNAQAALCEKLMDQLDGAGLTLSIVLRELFGFASPRTFQDFVRVQIDTVENPIELIDSIPFVLGTFVRQCLQIIFGLVFKVILKDLGKILLKVFPVLIVIEMVTQKVL